MLDNIPRISINESNKASVAKKRNRQEWTEYHKAYKRESGQNPAFKTKENDAMQSVRKDPVYKTKEREAKQSVRKDPVYKTKEREAKQSVRKYPVYKTKEREAMQSVRKDPVYKTKEREIKQSARENQTYTAQEKIKQNMSKRKARENPYVCECERIKKQQIRQEERKFNDNSGIDVRRKRCKHDMDTLPKNCHKDFVTAEECIKQFHSDISVGPLYVCTCCHQA